MNAEELARAWEAEAAERDDAVAVRLRSCAAQLRAASGGKTAAKVAGDVLTLIVVCALIAYCVYVTTGGR